MFLWSLTEGAHTYRCMAQVHINYVSKQAINMHNGGRIFTILGKLFGHAQAMNIDILIERVQVRQKLGVVGEERYELYPVMDE